MSAAPTKPGPLARVFDVLVGLFTRNLGVKIAALVMAVVVWFTVRQDITLSQELPVQVSGLSASDLAEQGLMPVGRYDTDVRVTFEGPRSEIDEIRKGERPRIDLRVSKANLLGQARRTLSFSLKDRNVEHPYGDSVAITAMDPEKISLEVAVKESRNLPVRRPTFDGSLGEWKLEGELVFTPEITVTGPKDVLDRLTEIRTKPIPVGEVLRGNGEENRRAVEGVLDLAEEEELEFVRRDRGQVIEYSATFVRSRVLEKIKVPFLVKYESLDSKVRLVIETGGIVELTDEDGRTIELEFTGRPADLENIRKRAEEGSIRAFIRAEDYKDYVDAVVGAGGNFGGTVRLEMPEDLFRRVQVAQPTLGDVNVSIVSR